MSMISPNAFIEFECKGKSYRELLKIRDELLQEVYDFEKGKIAPEEKYMLPSPGTVYQCNLDYLGELFKLISETYNEEVIYAEEDGEEGDQDEKQ